MSNSNIERAKVLANATALQCNSRTAHEFLKALGDREFTFQTFDDNATRKNCNLARVLHGTIDQHFAKLEVLNNKGAGIFVTVSRLTEREALSTPEPEVVP
jgi:hypothetical protein